MLKKKKKDKTKPQVGISLVKQEMLVLFRWFPS